MSQIDKKPKQRAAIVIDKTLNIIFLSVSVPALIWLFNVGVIHGTATSRFFLALLAFYACIGELTKRGVVKSIWIQRIFWFWFIIQCVGGPIFAIYFVGHFYGWW